MATLEFWPKKTVWGKRSIWRYKTSSKVRLELCYIKSLFPKAVQNTHGEKSEAVALPTLSLHKFNELYQILN